MALERVSAEGDSALRSLKLDEDAMPVEKAAASLQASTRKPSSETKRAASAATAGTEGQVSLGSLKHISAVWKPIKDV